ncbi:MAG: VCBS repeat-containing protein [bacterium]|nr:VCBS repeat-containing protein [bacterium]
MRASRVVLGLVAIAVAAGVGSWLWLEYAKQGFPQRRTADLPGGIVVEPVTPVVDGSTNAAGPRFRQRMPADCGIDFQNELRKENRFQYLTNGSGLAAGDYDDDGLVDLYFVSQDGSNRLFRQVAPWQFRDVTASVGNVDGGDAWGTGATFADVDGDGDLDLYVCNLEAKNLLYENQGNGTFRENAAAFGLDLVAASMMAAFCDYDRDGSLDLYLLTNRALHAGWARTPEVLTAFTPGKDTARAPTAMVPSEADWQGIGALVAAGKLTDESIPKELREHYLAFRGRPYMSGQEDRLLRNVGGRFVDVSTSAGITGHGMGLSASWCDYDNDGWPDLYVANDLESPDKLYHNERNGSFRLVTKDVLPHTAYYGMGSDWGDVDGDGALDLIVADMSMTTHQKAKVLMGDMNNQRPILMHAEPPQYMRNALLLNTGVGRFQEAGKLAGVSSTDWTWSVLFGDLDNDARLDLFATNGIARFDMDPDMQARVAELWSQRRHRAAIDVIQNLPAVPEKNIALRNRSDLKFERRDDWGLDLEAVSHGAVLVDLDGDADLDVVVNNWNAAASVYENTTSDGHGVIVRLRGQHSDRFGVGAKVVAELPDGSRLTRQMRLSRGYLSGQAPEVHFGVGDATTLNSIEVHWPAGHRQQFGSGLTAPARITITEPPDSPEPPAAAARRTASPWFERLPAPTFRHRENEFDDYADQPLLPERVSRLGPGLAVADLDGDGIDEMFIGGASGQSGQLLRGTADGRFEPRPGPWQEHTEREDLAALFFDADGDGDLDLFVSSGGASLPPGDPNLRDRLYQNDGDGKWSDASARLPDLAFSSGHAAAGDFDGDGDLDLFVAGRIVPGAFPDAPASRLYQNDGGNFVDVTATRAKALLTAGMVTSALFTDVDNDRDLDLLVAAHWQPIRLLRNDGGLFEDDTDVAGLTPFAGWWNSLLACDVDRDGDLDYLAGNRGLNTKYKASQDKPARLYFGDFDGNGTRDLVEAKHDGKRLLPVRGRSCSSGAMPFIAKKFETYQQFAQATLSEIYTPQKLDTCGEVFATTLASCLLRNDGTGGFVVEPLPRRAQLAPIFAMVALGDVIVCAENSFAPEPETGRHDGGTGLVLRLLDGELSVVPTAEHGLAIPGDMKAIALRCGSGGTIELLMSRNGATVSRQRVARTPDGIPTLFPDTLSPGDWLEFEFDDSSRSVAEISTGSGYLSASTRVVLQRSMTAVTQRAPDGATRRIDLATNR